MSEVDVPTSERTVEKRVRLGFGGFFLVETTFDVSVSLSVSFLSSLVKTSLVASSIFGEEGYVVRWVEMVPTGDSSG